MKIPFVPNIFVIQRGEDLSLNQSWRNEERQREQVCSCTIMFEGEASVQIEYK